MYVYSHGRMSMIKTHYFLGNCKTHITLSIVIMEQIRAAHRHHVSD